MLNYVKMHKIDLVTLNGIQTKLNMKYQKNLITELFSKDK